MQADRAFPQLGTTVISDACGWSRASAKKSSKVVPADRRPLNADSSKPVSHSIT
jgi:hypothetical protein